MPDFLNISTSFIANYAPIFALNIYVVKIVGLDNVLNDELKNLLIKSTYLINVLVIAFNLSTHLGKFILEILYRVIDILKA